MTGSPVIVVGAGWAGLAAAVELTARGIAVRVLESARQVGGRARCASFDGLGVDNGQHLLVGAYRETLRMLETVGVAEEKVLHRLPLALSVRDGAGSLAMRAPPAVPAPLHLLWALATATGLGPGGRMAALRLSLGLRKSRAALSEDCSVAELLRRQRQPETLVRRLWDPLCLAALNTPIERASARLFLSVLDDTFAGAARDADLLIPRVGLGHLFPLPAVDFLERHGGSVRLGQRATGLVVERGRVTGVRAGSEVLAADHIVLAVPPPAMLRLVEGHAGLSDVVSGLKRLAHEPITTIYLRYPETARLPLPVSASLGTRWQWLFDRRVCGQPGLFAAVISAGGEHMDVPPKVLAAEVADELARRWPSLPKPTALATIREKRATFAAEAGVERLRPAARTPVKGLWLAGDHTATPYPATIEGAVLSGVQCARHIMDNADP